ncbi:putative iron/ascorbate oxidoreductase DDB_G0283291 isoform X2 [Oculina patagonica]
MSAVPVINISPLCKSNESESTGGSKNIREAIYFGPADESPSKEGTDTFPEPNGVPDFGDTVRNYMEQTKNIGFILMKALAVSLGLHKDFFNDSCSSPLNTLGIFHYPPHPDDNDSWGVGTHTDFGLVTILLQDSIGGLEVEINQGEWVPVKPIPGSFVINIGDCLEVWTKGLYRATRHRVKNSVAKDRYSAAFFFNPDAKCIIQPLEIEMTQKMSFKTSVNGMQMPFLFGDYKNYLVNKGLASKED